VKDKDKKEWHIGCGGEVIRSPCIKCGGKKKGLMSKIFGEGPLIIREKDIKETQRKEHKRRIREGRDIFRE
jgi:hypothetical protein